ncbi:mitochondrial 2-oxoglutarate/malate carrier protein-like isoform X2 [Aricia agestis]|nr:mitochondrial 2-oxoglutarate/malate carrier protein-like isoform X2 [Aricia agestis]
MLAICVVQPADLMKTRMQLLGPERKSLVAVAGDILRTEGAGGFYKGLTAALFRQATYTTGRMGCFNSVSDYYKTNYGTPSFATKVGIGVVSGAVGAYVGTPAEVALIRMTADGRLPPEKRRNYRNVFNALARIVREEGLFTLWRGAGATVTRAMVVNGSQLAVYAQAREMLLTHMGEGISLHFVSSMISGLATSLASLPVDIVKTRVQNAEKGTSQLKVLTNVIRNEGVLTLWSGFIPTYCKIGPHTVLTFIFLEQLNKLYYTYVQNE